MAEIISDMIEEEGTPVSELQEDVGGSETPVVEDTIPEKFRGKSAKDIAESYTNLEKEYGKKAQEIGELRKLTDQILQQQIAQSTRKEEPKVESSDDDFFVDPQAAIGRAIENHPKVKQFEQQAVLANQQANLQKFTAKHSDYEAILQEEEFRGWIDSSPVRQRLLSQANSNYDFESADEIFSQYKERKQLIAGAQQQVNDNREAALKASTVPTGNNSAESSKKVYRRADLIRLKMTDPSRYEALSDDILQAYAEGRVK